MRRKSDGQLTLLELDPPQAAQPIVAKKKVAPAMSPAPVRQLLVCKRDGTKQPFDQTRIASAIESAFKVVRGIPADEPLSKTLQTVVTQLASKTTLRIHAELDGETVQPNRIDDAVENELMAEGYFTEARRYILFREGQRGVREQVVAEVAPQVEEPPAASAPEPTTEIPSIAAPQYTVRYDSSFSRAIEDAVHRGLLVPELLGFDFGTMSNKLNFDRDRLIKPDVLQWLAETCFVRNGERHLETPQFFWMRIAMALAINERTERERRAFEFYEALSTLRFLPSETILRNAGRTFADPMSISGDINIATHLQDGMLNEFMLDRTVTAVVRLLDNTIEFSGSRKDFCELSSNRPISIGFVNLNETAMISVNYTIEAAAYWATLESVVLAEERGPFMNYLQSDWLLGILPIDTVQLSQEQSGSSPEVTWHLTKDWTAVRAAIRQHGVRNDQLFASTPEHGSHKLLGAAPKKPVDNELPTFLDEADASKVLQSIQSS
jgi:hypothetical protein